MLNRVRGLLFSLAIVFAVGARAVEGVDAESILLGMSSPFSGLSGPYGLQMKEGIEAYFAKVNAAGGVFGRKLALRALDDGYDTEPAVANAHQLIEKDKVFALIAFYGSSPSAAVLPVIEAARVPLVGTVSGAGELRKPDNHYLFNVRASYADETASIVQHLTTIGIRRVAVLYQDDGFGQSGLKGVTEALAQHKLAPVATGSVARNSTDLGPAVTKIAGKDAQAVVMVTLYKATAEFIKRMRSAGESPMFVALSPVGTNNLIELLGADKSTGIVVAQVIPRPWSDKAPLVREYKQSMASFRPNAAYSYFGLEGYVYAKLMTAALMRCGANPTREKLVDALHAGPFDLGGFRVNFKPGSNTGSTYVEMSVIGEGGKIIN